jgi:Tfp pilus assembly protein PilN
MAGGTEGTALARDLRITLGRLPEAVRGQVTRARWVGPFLPGLGELLKPLGIDNLEDERSPGTPSAEAAAALYLSQRPVPFEFVIPEVNHWPARFERFNTRLGRRIAAGTAAVFLLLILVFIVRSHMENSLNTEWDGMRNSVAELDGLQQNIRRFRPWFAGSPQKLQALETLFAAFPEKGEVWARSVQLAAYQEKSENSSRMVVSTEASKVTVSGFARSQAALMGLQEHLRKQSGVSALQLQQVRGNNPIQFSLTFKWEPKHDL